jgi:hypothetical protein
MSQPRVVFSVAAGWGSSPSAPSPLTGRPDRFFELMTAPSIQSSTHNPGCPDAPRRPEDEHIQRGDLKNKNQQADPESAPR